MHMPIIVANPYGLVAIGFLLFIIVYVLLRILMHRHAYR